MTKTEISEQSVSVHAGEKVNPKELIRTTEDTDDRSLWHQTVASVVNDDAWQLEKKSVTSWRHKWSTRDVTESWFRRDL